MTKLILIPYLGSGGAEKVAVNLCKALNFDGMILFESVVKYNISHNKIFCINSKASRSLLKKFLNLPIRYFCIKRMKTQLKPDLTLSLLEPANFYNIITKRKKEKVILSFHSHYTSDISYGYYWLTGIKKKILLSLYKLAFRHIYNKADLLIHVSNGGKEDLIQNFGLRSSKLKVIYNPIFTEEILKKIQEPIEPIFENISYIITTGRLTQAKGQWYLIRVFRKLKEIFPELKLLILGEGELKEYLVSLSENLELKTFVWDRDKLLETFDVYFMGFQKNPFKYIAKAKLLVAPSLWEGFPNTLLEAMACGVTVVSADCKSGPREILAPETDFRETAKNIEFASYGLLVPPFEVQYKNEKEPLEEKELMLYEAVKKLLEDESLRKDYVQKTQIRAKDFDIEVIMKEWQEVLNEIL